jgi:hypothetical protein
MNITNGIKPLMIYILSMTSFINFLNSLELFEGLSPSIIPSIIQIILVVLLVLHEIFFKNKENKKKIKKHKFSY